MIIFLLSRKYLNHLALVLGIFYVFGINYNVSSANYFRRRSKSDVDLTLFEGENGTGSSIAYSENVGWFDDVPALLEENNIEGIQSLCVENGL